MTVGGFTEVIKAKFVPIMINVGKNVAVMLSLSTPKMWSRGTAPFILNLCGRWR
jgi:hypothetical protein